MRFPRVLTFLLLSSSALAQGGPLPSSWSNEELASRTRSAVEELTRLEAQALADRIRAEASHLAVETCPGYSQVGSGSMPGESLPTTLVRVTHPDLSASAFARRLRFGDPPLYTRIVDEATCLDPRTLLDENEEADVVRLLKEIR